MTSTLPQHLSKPPAFPQVDRILVGVAPEGVHEHRELLVPHDLDLRVGWAGRVGLVRLVQVEAHLLVHHPILQHLHPCQHGDGHVHLLLLHVGARDVPGEHTQFSKLG